MGLSHFSKKEMKQMYQKSCTDHLGNTFPSITTMCEHYGISTDTFNKRRNEKHMSLKDALTIPVKKRHNGSCKDHLGNEFPSTQAMCEHYGIDRNVFDYRIYEKHMPIKDALTKPTRKQHNGPCKDHLGNEFPNQKAMCKHYGISYDTFYRRMTKNHMSLKDALTTALPKKTCEDHLGNKFPSVIAMCEHYNITRPAFDKRIEKGWSIKDALTTPVQKRNTPCTDHLGNTFPSITAMCKHYHILQSAFYDRIDKQHMSLKDALTTSVQKNNKSCMDYLGNTFPNINAMCEHYNITRPAFDKRIKKGRSLKDALTEPVRKKNESCTDYLGNTFPNVKAMCKHYNVDTATFKQRCETGYSIEEALSIIPIINFKTKNLQLTQNLFIKEMKAKKRKTLYAICIYNSIETLLTHDEIIEIYRSETRNAP